MFLNFRNNNLKKNVIKTRFEIEIKSIVILKAVIYTYFKYSKVHFIQKYIMT